MGVMKVKKLRPNARLPEYMTEDAAGMDFFACLDYSVAILPHEFRMISFGIAYELPMGYWLDLRGRSSLEGVKNIMCVDDTACHPELAKTFEELVKAYDSLQTVYEELQKRHDEMLKKFENNRLFCAHEGVIEPGYRGELSILLYNAGRFPYTINPGDRVAQGIIQERHRFGIEETDELSLSARGETGGFGSTGV